MHWATLWAKGSGIIVTPSVGGVKSKRKYTRLHTWTLYFILHQWYSNNSLKEELESNSHGYSALPLSEQNLAKTLQWIIMISSLWKLHWDYCKYFKLQWLSTRGVHLHLGGRRVEGWSDPCDLSILPSSRLGGVEVPCTWEAPLHGIWMWIVWCLVCLSWGPMGTQGFYSETEAPVYSYIPKSNPPCGGS